MSDEGDPPPAPGAAKRPYEKPAIVWQESLEIRPTLAVACAKVDPSGGPPCDAGAPGS